MSNLNHQEIAKSMKAYGVPDAYLSALFAVKDDLTPDEIGACNAIVGYVSYLGDTYLALCGSIPTEFADPRPDEQRSYAMTTVGRIYLRRVVARMTRDELLSLCRLLHSVSLDPFPENAGVTFFGGVTYSIMDLAQAWNESHPDFTPIQYVHHDYIS